MFCCQSRLYDLLNRAGSRLLRGCARKIFLGPDKPVPHPLIFGQSFIRAFHHRLRICFCISQNEHRARLRISISRQRDHDAIFDLGLAAQRSLQILGINVHSGGRHDHIFLASFEIQVALGVERADVAGSVPAFLGCHRLQFLPGPISGRNAASRGPEFHRPAPASPRAPPALCRSILCPDEKDDSR